VQPGIWFLLYLADKSGAISNITTFHMAGPKSKGQYMFTDKKDFRPVLNQPRRSCIGTSSPGRPYKMRSFRVKHLNIPSIVQQIESSAVIGQYYGMVLAARQNIDCVLVTV